MTAPTEAPAEPDTSAAAAAHFGFFTFEVQRTRRIGHSFLRVTFGGESLREFRSGGYDQSLSLFLPLSHQEHTVLPSTDEDTWFGAWRAMPEAERPVMRSYTVRDQRRSPSGGVEVDVDFVLHGDASPASAWAGRARAGSRIMAIGPRTGANKSVRFQPPAGTRTVLLYADETALPAAAAILARLPEGTAVKAWFQVPHADDRLDLAAPADAEVVWIQPAADGSGRTGQVLEALRADGSASGSAPAPGTYAWVAGEAGTVRAVRRHFVQERHIDRRCVRFTGYWRLGASEEELLAEAYAGKAPSEDPESAL
ncbi:siderophore-interacting protein [Streptomyces bambusae]|uniref:siderophore-interacting protein n=1 Tax=Streptomyces bambusae TaxID=1550616 RepID=UPI001CFCEA7F|nr:siderophore-interacting protein [Streptomyces bambusae]MCB5167857.1 siderophore-interacting protein [Streptomyces bambusae]